MARISSSQLVVTRAANATWTLRPREGRAYKTPVSYESLRRVYGAESVNFTYAGKFGGAQRFQVSVDVINARGLSGMDGALQAMIDEVDVVQRFLFAWPQPLNANVASNQTTGATAGAVGDASMQLAAGAEMAQGRMVQFEANGKLHRVVNYASSTRLMRFFPALTKAVAPGTTVLVNPVGYARFASKPTIILNRGIVLESTLVVREALS